MRGASASVWVVIGANQPRRLGDSFVPRRRATLISVVYAAGVALFGGSTPFVVAWLGRVSGSPLAPGWYVAMSSALAFVALWQVDEPMRARPFGTSSFER